MPAPACHEVVYFYHGASVDISREKNFANIFNLTFLMIA